MRTIDPQALLLLPHLKVQNANAISSSLTWGFPAMTAFAGFVHALHRLMRADFGILLEGVGVVCHHYEALVSQPAGKHTKAFHLRHHPSAREGKPTDIVEDGRAHFDVSLIIGVHDLSPRDSLGLQQIAERARELAGGKRLAGGSILPVTSNVANHHAPTLLPWPASPEEKLKLSRKITQRLLPGYTLVSREALLQQHLEKLQKKQPDADVLDALLDISCVNIDPKPMSPILTPLGRDITPPWRTRHKPAGLVPIPAGYAALSRLYSPGEAEGVRDSETPFCFVETLLTLGQWLGPHRLDDVCQLLWYHDGDVSSGLYRCSTPYFAQSTTL